MESLKKTLLCIILAGGKGTRLDGKGKLNQKLNNKTLLEHVYDRIKNQFNLIAINVNDEKRSTDLELELIFDKFSGNIGPLAGIHSALYYGNDKLGKNGYVFTVPVDTPFLPKDLARRLYDNIIKYNSDVVMAKSGDRVHPTVAIWKNSLKSKLELKINKGIRKIDLFTSELKVTLVEWKISKLDPFYNINNYDDLKKAKKIKMVY